MDFIEIPLIIYALPVTLLVLFALTEQRTIAPPAQM